LILGVGVQSEGSLLRGSAQCRERL
jgi:hypothetical protein